MLDRGNTPSISWLPADGATVSIRLAFIIALRLSLSHSCTFSVQRVLRCDIVISRVVFIGLSEQGRVSNERRILQLPVISAHVQSRVHCTARLRFAWCEFKYIAVQKRGGTSSLGYEVNRARARAWNAIIAKRARDIAAGSKRDAEESEGGASILGNFSRVQRYRSTGRRHCAESSDSPQIRARRRSSRIASRFERSSGGG